MMREEAIKTFEEILQLSPTLDETGCSVTEAMKVALTALRPVSREQVVKVWRGCEYCKKHKIKLVRIEMDYNETPGSPKRLNPTRTPKFCPICGTPMTDEAVDILLKRLEALKDGKGD